MATVSIQPENKPNSGLITRSLLYYLLCSVYIDQTNPVYSELSTFSFSESLASHNQGGKSLITVSIGQNVVVNSLKILAGDSNLRQPRTVKYMLFQTADHNV